jgi:hypothetical protein
MDNNYEKKYLKYKSKYLSLKRELEGGKYSCTNDVVFMNQLGTCWNIAPLLILFFNEIFVNTSNNFLEKKTTDIIVSDSELKELKCTVPSILYNEDNTLKKDDIITFLRELHDFVNKYLEYTKDNLNLQICKIQEEKISNITKKLLNGATFEKDNVAGGGYIDMAGLVNVVGILIHKMEIISTIYDFSELKTSNINYGNDLGSIILFEYLVVSGLFA